MTNSIQVYANIVNTISEPEHLSVFMTGIDPSQVLAEFSDEEKLESMDLSSIEGYLRKRLEENE